MKSKEDEMGIVCSTYGKRNIYRAPVGNPEGNRLLGKHRCRWKDHITRSSWKNYSFDMTWIANKTK
jgi:hypothetical protein